MSPLSSAQPSHKGRTLVDVLLGFKFSHGNPSSQNKSPATFGQEIVRCATNFDPDGSVLWSLAHSDPELPICPGFVICMSSFIWVCFFVVFYGKGEPKGHPHYYFSVWAGGSLQKDPFQPFLPVDRVRSLMLVQENRTPNGPSFPMVTGGRNCKAHSHIPRIPPPVNCLNSYKEAPQIKRPVRS